MGKLLGVILLLAALPTQAYELRKCEWLADRAFEQAWLRDSGLTLKQMKVMIWQSPERPEVQTGLVALARFVYSHRDETPDQLADNLLRDCRGYDQ